LFHGKTSTWRIGLANELQVFLNIVLDDAVEEKDGGEKVRLGMVVSSPLLSNGYEGKADINKYRLFEETPLSCWRRWRE